MPLTENLLKAAEKVLKIKLTEQQKDFILLDKPFPDMCPCLIDFVSGAWSNKEKESMCMDNEECQMRNRRTGRTLAYIIKLILSQGEPLDMRKPERFCDYPYTMTYASYFRNFYYDIWQKLKSAGLPVRQIIK